MWPWVDDILHRHYDGTRWLVTSDVVQGATGTATHLRDTYGAEVLVLAARMGTGPIPEGLRWHCLDIGGAADLVESIHGAERALRDLPADVQALVDAFDPDHRARALGPIFSNGKPVAGRPFFGGRPASWQALEDKVVIDALWDAADVPRAPVRITPVTLQALTAAASELDQGLGTVWAGDAREGFHGGGVLTFPVTAPGDAERAVERLSARCDRARVMPFLHGLPCSIHGIVFDDHVIAIRPCEMVVMRRPDGRFQYANAGRFWTPPDEVDADMRAITARVGVRLRDTVDYRGAFSIDGVLTDDGFRPTELNPRIGGALSHVAPKFPADLVNHLLIGRVEADWRPAELEAALLRNADTHRRAAFSMMTDAVWNKTREFTLGWGDGAWVEVDPDEADATLMVGPSGAGGFLRLKLVPERTPVGPPVAPRAVALAAWADAHLGTAFGPLEAAELPARWR